ncbi:MAG: radical SAM protein [Sellimonas intestinalis]
MPCAVPSVPMDEVLAYEEICEITRAAALEGIHHVRVTGGEPLVRKGCPDCVRMLKEIPGIETVMLTTNGVLLKEALPELLLAGIDGINISLDTLKREKYREITGYDGLPHVLEAIEACVKAGIRTKINVVAARGDQRNGDCEIWPNCQSSIRGCPVHRDDADWLREMFSWA